MNFRILAAKAQKYTQILKATVKPQDYYIYPKKSYIHHRVSFSQEGEDLVLMRMFEGQESGFYVDIGAHHPQRFSNTYLFYLKGWQGINIDAMPGSMDLFKKIRPRDINLEIAISDKEEILTYHEFNEPALNSFSVELSREYEKTSPYKIIKTWEIKTKPLADILESHLEVGQVIDFMSIDVEGLDYQVLVSNDWSKYRPSIILIEELSMNLKDASSKVGIFLRDQGYELFSKTFYTSFYRPAK